MSDYSQLRKSLGLSAASTRRLRKENNLSKEELYNKMYAFANPDVSKIQGVRLALPEVLLPKKQYTNASVEIGEISGPVNADTGEAIGYKLVKVTRPKPLSEKEKQRQERAAREEAFWRGEIDAPSVSDWVKLRDAKYEGLTDLQIRDYSNWKKMGYGNTVDEYKQWLAKEHKSNLDTVKIAKAAATGIVGTAATVGLGSMLGSSLASGAKYLPGMIRDYVTYDKVMNPLAEKVTENMDDGFIKDATREALAFGGTNLASGLYRLGKRYAMGKLSNVLDQEATRLGMQYGEKAGVAATKTSKILRDANTSNMLLFGNPNVTANTVKGIGIGAGVAAVEDGLDAVGVDNPYIKEGIKFGAMALTPKLSGFAGKRFTANSGGALTVDKAISNLKNTKKTAYSLDDPLYAAKNNSYKAGTGNNTLNRGVSGESPMHTWGYLMEGATYTSPYWDKVDPDAKFANQVYKYFYQPGTTRGDAYRARRPFGSVVEIKSAQTLPEFKQQANEIVDKLGKTLMQNMQNMNTLGLHHVDSDIKIARAPGIGKELNIFRNEKGHIETGLYQDKYGNKIISRSDYGGTGSGGNEGFKWNSERGTLNNLLGFGKNKAAHILKSHIDTEAQRSLPVTVNNAISKSVRKSSTNKFGISKDNNTAYHIDEYGQTYLPVFQGTLAKKGLIH